MKFSSIGSNSEASGLEGDTLLLVLQEPGAIKSLQEVPKYHSDAAP